MLQALPSPWELVLTRSELGARQRWSAVDRALRIALLWLRDQRQRAGPAVGRTMLLLFRPNLGSHSCVIIIHATSFNGYRLAGWLIKAINQAPRSLNAVWSFFCLCPPSSAGPGALGMLWSPRPDGGPGLLDSFLLPQRRSPPGSEGRPSRSLL